MLARWSSASFCSRRSLSFLAQVRGSLGSPVQPPAMAPRATRAAKRTIWIRIVRTSRRPRGQPIERPAAGPEPRVRGAGSLLAGSAASLHLGLHGEVDVVVTRRGRRIHDLLERLEFDALVGLDDGQSIERLGRMQELVVVLEGDELIVQL